MITRNYEPFVGMSANDIWSTDESINNNESVIQTRDTWVVDRKSTLLMR